MAIGDSIATNGVCLTVINLPGDGFWADVSRETLIHTRFESLQMGERVNLEKALLPSTRMGGHIVTGHVDAIGEIVAKSQDARSIKYTVRAADSIAAYIATKGSITVDGVSLTVNSVSDNEDGSCNFGLNIIPHTAEVTTLGNLTQGHEVNLEIDVLARYLKRMQSLASS